MKTSMSRSPRTRQTSRLTPTPGAPLLLLALPLWLLATACEPAPTDGRFPDQHPDATGAADAAASDAASSDSAATSDPYSGAWALATDWSVCVTVGSRIETRSRKLLLVQMKRSGQRILETRTLCRLQLTAIFGLQTVIPDPVIQAVGPMHVESRVLGEGTDGVAYAGGAEAQLMGIKLVNPVYDAMPTSAQTDDPRLVDTEGDGQPGATFNVGSACKLYVAQREVSQLTGQLVAPGRFEGGAVHGTEQVVLGSSAAVCGQPFKTFSNSPHHRFVLQRLSGLGWDDDQDGAVSCAELVAHQSELITWATPDDKRCGATK